MTSSIGIFGKLPAHGDFVDRGLAPGFLTIWDEWLQRCIASSRHQLDSQWLDFYLYCPIWRFSISSGVVDSQSRIGILLPSVDSIGRYFPLTITQLTPNQPNPYKTLISYDNWFRNAENIAVNALNNGDSVDIVLNNLANLSENDNIKKSMPTKGLSPMAGCFISQTEDNNHASLMSELLYQQRQAVAPANSCWLQNTQEQQTLFDSEGLPPPESFTKMLTGQWDKG
ncbi:type VI secretion system-associated protein TagF [Marinibactrum halimedae]|uniref:Type VI secretion-associated protein n=1 Tax=Marinibactrum halimedae TaxID=1444977 RepID=A0AA37T2Y7_9GAMM|nr:type VI secretion system-associated protein TagF [Marinibactrum halimedae]MCD9458357.1 type VI secretion system-associated protein TagF [Marinibactrum halimedae]GLS26054.1 type VI secretion-associated protein [Marinibactrum halimedae]